MAPLVAASTLSQMQMEPSLRMVPVKGEVASLNSWRTSGTGGRGNSALMLERSRLLKLRVLSSFLPRAVMELLAELTPEAAAAMQPTHRRLEGAVVVLFDLCSFTKLAEGLRLGNVLLSDSDPGADLKGNGLTSLLHIGGDQSELAGTYTSQMLSAKILRMQNTADEQAGYGAEQLKDLLKVFFQELMGTLTDYGGDVMRLAGDALIAVFHDGGAATRDLGECPLLLLLLLVQGRRTRLCAARYRYGALKPRLLRSVKLHAC
jgi:hypothetical protein